jgi:hypothetical protein
MMMRSILVVTMSVALLAGTALAPAMAQDSSATPPQDSTQQQDSAPAPQPQANPTMPKPVPKKQPSDTTLVVGGIAAIVGVLVAVGSGGGDDHPSSP